MPRRSQGASALVSAARRAAALFFGLTCAALIAACAQSGDDSAASAVAGAGTGAGTGTAASTERPPNIVLIVADDLGYSDLGVFGSEIPTPNLDALARSGMLLTTFYAGMTCSPARAMLLSGMDNHLAGLGVMAAPRREDHQGQPGYTGYLNFQVASLGEVLSDGGYNTYMTGKWHLGNDVETGPRARGFRRSFVSLDGAAHLGPWDWRGPQNARYRDGEEIVHVDDSFYSTQFYTERMIEYIDQDRGDGKPFFAYLAYTAPHWPIQAPKASIERFRGRYDDGYEALYHQRFERQKALGFVADGTEPLDDARFEPRWSELTEEQKQVEARHMEIYAAMVSDLDAYVGQFIDYLKSIGEYENTLILFMSDNGAESGRMDLSDSIQEHVGVEYDHSLDNLGSATSYVNYGRNWASVSASPLNRHKFTGFDGGIRVPAFAHFPGRVPEGTRHDGVTTIMDVLPTLLDLAGIRHPGTHYKGREVLPPQGASLLPVLYGKSDAVRPEDHEFGWELFGHRSVRKGDWKLVWDHAAPAEERRWALYDLSSDPLERRDLSQSHPDQYAAMLEVWGRYVENSGVIY